ncbi:MAG TPA: sodium-dependent transporter, partial [Bacillota bacterium]|nr:sodium-dependent transporter [Bacillota bacterium]
SLKYITPVVLGYMMFQLLSQNILKKFDTDTGNYEGYTDAFIMFGGWFVAGGALIIGILLMYTKWKEKETEIQETREAK